VRWFSLALNLFTLVVVLVSVEFVLLGWARNEETIGYVARQRGDEELAVLLEAKARRLRRLAWPLRLFVRP
jgi:hypothetical protein